MGNLDGTILANRPLRGPYWLMEILVDGEAAAPEPGRFVMLRVSSSSSDPLLRRPFGIHDFTTEEGGPRLKLLYRVCGKGTSLMTRLREGDRADILGPLGKGFLLPADGSRPVIVAGGIGAAPLLFLARRMRDEGLSPLVCAGGDTARDVLGEREFQALGLEFRAATMDGTFGFGGNVVDCMLAGVDPRERISCYACGPRPMTARLAHVCRERGWRMQATVETYMACGMGLCLGCAVRAGDASREKYRMACNDGPVFDLEEIRWENPT